MSLFQTNSANVKVVDEKWILKTSSGKTARSANKEKFLKELAVH